MSFALVLFFSAAVLLYNDVCTSISPLFTPEVLLEVSVQSPTSYKLLYVDRPSAWCHQCNLAKLFLFLCVVKNDQLTLAECVC